MITERQRERIIEYLSAHAQNELHFPMKVLSEFLLDNFGVSKPTGKEIVKTLIAELDGSKKIHCTYDAKGAIRTIRLAPPDIESPVPSAAAKPVIPHPLPATSLRKGPRHTPKKLEKGEARRRRRAHEIGDGNENRCHRIAKRLVELLKRVFSERIVSADCTKSGRHNPHKGKINIADHHGEDIGIALAARLDDTTIIQGRIIEDVKSSERAAAKFNKKIYFGRYEVETGVLLKRAITVNPRRTDLEIARELLANIAAAGFPFVLAQEEIILRAFRSF